MFEIHLTNHAQLRLAEIEEYSLENFGTIVCKKYMQDIADKIQKLGQKSDLGKIRDDISDKYFLLSVRSHYIIYDIINTDIYIVTIENQRRDVQSLLSDLEPYFEKQIQLLQARL